jgi:hypothetical protein
MDAFGDLGQLLEIDGSEQRLYTAETPHVMLIVERNIPPE